MEGEVWPVCRLDFLGMGTEVWGGSGPIAGEGRGHDQ